MGEVLPKVAKKKNSKGVDQKVFVDLCRSFYVTHHPILQEKYEYRQNYCHALSYFIKKYCKCVDSSANAMLEHYCRTLLGKQYSAFNFIPITEERIRPAVKKVAAIKFKRFALFSYRFVFMVDCLFLCAFHDENTAKEIVTELKALFHARYHRKFDLLFSALYHGASLGKGMDTVTELVSIWNYEQEFFKCPRKKILVTANMSAGKSTLINALVGKPLMRMAQEACTGHICHIWNKPFEDGENALKDSRLLFGVNKDALLASEHAGDCQIATCYRTFVNLQNPFCIIDTPGVNSTIKSDHGKVAKKALREDSYDFLVYVLNASQIGTNDEMNYIRYLAENVPKEKIIFVVNKLDTFKKKEDSIEESIQGIRQDLLQLGFDYPVIFPISAYCSLLIKLKLIGVPLTEDQEDEFEYYVKKYSQSEYDLSKYYDISFEYEKDDILTKMSIKCGLYGLETMLFGGRSDEKSISQI